VLGFTLVGWLYRKAWPSVYLPGLPGIGPGWKARTLGDWVCMNDRPPKSPAGAVGNLPFYPVARGYLRHAS
jgi:hypothetical protein